MKYVAGIISRDTLEFYYRDAEGFRQCDTFPAEHVAYFKYEDLTPAMKRDRRVLSGKREDTGWTRVMFKPGYYDRDRPNKWTGKLGMWVPYREQTIKEWGIPSYEADVSPLGRFMADHDIEIGKSKRCYFDIETDSRVKIDRAIAGEARVLCWTVVDEQGRRQRGVLEEDTDEAEATLLNQLWIALDPFDVAVGWNSDRFDTPIIKLRSKLLDVPFPRYLNFLDHMQAYKRHNVASAASGEDKQSFKLDHVATQLLGEGKHDVDASRAYEYWAAGGAEREKLVYYCEQDTDLLRRIEAETGYIDLTQEICELTGIFLNSGALKPTKQVDAFMLRMGRQKGVHFRTQWYGEDLDVAKFPGAYVMEPAVHGVTHDVMVADFASLYPSIIITWNLSPDVKDPNGTCVSPSTGVRTSNEREGIICTALKQLLAKRKEYKAAGNKRAEKAVKIVANSFYGVQGTPYSRFYDRELCESTTQNGAWLIKTTIAAAEEMKGCRAVYADTDSCFLVGASEEEFRAFVARCNADLYPSLTAGMGVRECAISLAYDKHMERIVFTAAKRYVAKVAGVAKAHVKGLEINRGDTNRLARQLQQAVVDMIVAGELSPQPYEALIAKYRERIATEPLALDWVVITKGLKELDEYEVDPPHVRVARILKERGEDIAEGTRVSYVVIDGYASPKSVIPAQDYTGQEVDRDFLWNTSVYEPTLRLLNAAFPNGQWSRWSRGTRKPKHRVDKRQLALDWSQSED